MAGKLAIALGASTPDSVQALIVAQGLGAETPLATVRSLGSTVVTTLIPKRLSPGPTIAPALQERGVTAFIVKAPVRGESVLEVSNAARTLVRRSAPFRAMPARLADVPGGLTFVLASCAYHWPPYLRLIAERLREGYGLGGPPRFALLAGDNIYLDLPKPADQTAGDVVDRYLKYFLDEGYGAARACLPAFSTYDDHEYWNDYPELAFPVSMWLSERERDRFEAAAKECLELFQRRLNPAPLGAARFTYRIDIPPLSICVIDTRSDRDPVSAPMPRLMFEEDLLELERWAATLVGPGILVVGQPLWIEPEMKKAGVTGDHNVSFFKHQYDRICRALEQAPFDVMVCSGDVHYSRVLRIVTRNQRVLYEVASSPLVSIPSNLASAVQAVFGSAQRPLLQQGVEDTARPPRAGWLANYHMGTGNGTTFGVLNVQPKGSGVSVGLAFIDLRTGKPAELVRSTPLGEAPASLQVCKQSSAFQLGPKLV